MKITYEYDDGTTVTIKAPRSVIYALDAELYEIMDTGNNTTRFPHLKQLWYNTIGQDEDGDLI